jgi:hypothetical protein
MMERFFAVAIRDGQDLFLWFRVRRASLGDIYYTVYDPNRRIRARLEEMGSTWESSQGRAASP